MLVNVCGHVLHHHCLKSLGNDLQKVNNLLSQNCPNCGKAHTENQRKNIIKEIKKKYTGKNHAGLAAVIILESKKAAQSIGSDLGTDLVDEELHF